MTAPHADQLIDGYLARLRAAAADLPTSAREELLSDVQSHIAEARGRESEETDASILNILDRLGEPVVVVAEARERLGVQTPTLHRSGLVEIAAVVLLPTIWIVGVILLWWSPAWKTRDKIIGTICSLGGYPTVLFLGAMMTWGTMVGSGGCITVTGPSGVISQSCSQTSLLHVIAGILLAIVGMLLILLPLLTSLYLALRLRHRRKAEAAFA